MDTHIQNVSGSHSAKGIKRRRTTEKKDEKTIHEITTEWTNELTATTTTQIWIEFLFHSFCYTFDVHTHTHTGPPKYYISRVELIFFSCMQNMVDYIFMCSTHCVVQRSLWHVYTTRRQAQAQTLSRMHTLLVKRNEMLFAFDKND